VAAPAELAGAGVDDEVRPLVLDGRRLYLNRWWEHESRIVEHMTARASAPGREVDGLHDVLDACFGSEPAEGADLQRSAASMALTRSLAVIAGGPGTGKTRTIARLLVAAVTAGLVEPGDVALGAPTGKAAARMGQALRAAIAELRDGQAPDASLDGGSLDGLAVLEPSTLHRLLQPVPGGGFRRSRANPLPQRLVIVDEASMVSANLMARLLEAVDDEATLVLVGDPHQLASVEAGAVFGDLVAAAQQAGAGAPLTGCLTVLEQVHRFGAGSGIARLAAAVRDGDADAALGLLRAGGGDVEWHPVADPGGAQPAMDRVVEAGTSVVEAARRGDGEAAAAVAESVKVLAATRRGRNGMRDWGQRIERSVDQRTAMGRGAQWYVGRPVLVTRNDPLVRVVNGDVGVVVASDGAARVAVAEGDGCTRAVPVSRLPDVETWWAMTIHKSQGSEFPEVVVALPEAAVSPILTRELLYTAVTRAQQKVTVVATEAAIRAAVERPVVRASGLRERLGG
jgi:exodeoxyribonuclease V alpha subunit